MRKFIASTLILFLLSACGGREPNLIKVTRISDSNLSCTQLLIEIDDVENQVTKLTSEQSSKNKKNLGLQVAGVFLLVPYFFMDLSDTEKAEINAYRARYFHLIKLAKDSGCAGFNSNEQQLKLNNLLNSLESLHKESVLSDEDYQLKREEVIQEFNLVGN